MPEAFGLRMDRAGGVQLSPGLATWPIHDSRGIEVARAHGMLVRGWLGPGLRLDGPILRFAGEIASADAFETQVMEGLRGLLLFETVAPLPRRLYPDCGATIPLVWCSETGQIGSSAGHILDADAYQRRFLTARFEKFVGGEGQNGWITGSMTAHAGVSRLLANHYLDLETLTAHRFWPRAGQLDAPPPGLEDCAQAVADDLRGYAQAVVDQHSLAVTLTAGLDSRLMLAALGPRAQDVSFFTFASERGGPDREIPARICSALGLSYAEYPPIAASAAEIAQWDHLVGHAMRESNRLIHPTMRQIRAEAIMTGLYGEPSRGFLYAHDWQTVNDVAAEPHQIIGRLKQPQDPELTTEIAAWMAPIAHLPRSTILDLAYLELRMGNWAMGQNAVQAALKPAYMPFAQWRIQAAFLALPLDVRGGGLLLPRIGEILWPAVMQFPINRFGDYRDHLGPLARIGQLGNPQKVIRYLRKRMAQ